MRTGASILLAVMLLLLLPTPLSPSFAPIIPCLPSYISSGSVFASAGGETAANSGLIFTDYSVYARNSTRVLTEILSSDQISLEARFRIPESIRFSGDIEAMVTGGGFNGGVNLVRINEQQAIVTILFELTYTGSRTTQLMFNLFGKRSIGGGEAQEFNEPRNITITECRPEDDSIDVITPSGPSEPPRFEVDLSARFPVAVAGQTYVLEIPVKNVGKQAAKDIVISIDPGDSADFPFEYDKYEFTARMAELKTNSVRNARFEVRVLPTAKDGPHSVKVNFSGRTVLGVGSLSESTETIVITVKNINTAPKLTLPETETI